MPFQVIFSSGKAAIPHIPVLGNWISGNVTLNNYFAVAATNGGTFVAVNSDNCGAGSYHTNVNASWIYMTSTDGVNWSEVTPITTYFGTGINECYRSFYCLKNVNGNLLGFTYGSNGEKAWLHSSDGLSWSRTLQPVGAGTHIWNGVAAGGGVYVAVSNEAATNNVLTSTDGATWSYGSNPATIPWTDVIYGASKFIAFSGTSLGYSTDGVNWTTVAGPGGVTWNNGIYANGQFVLVGTGTQVATSPDGTTWTLHTVPGTSSVWSSVTYGNGYYVAVASNLAITMTSQDGINWTQLPAAASKAWTGVTYNSVSKVYTAIANNYTAGANRAMALPFV